MRLEYDSEVNEVSVAAPFGFIPTKVDVLLSVGHSYDSPSDTQYSSFGVLDFSTVVATGANRSVQKLTVKSFGLCSGHIRLIVHKPEIVRLPKGDPPLNPYVQVGLLSVEIWGREGIGAAKTQRSFVEPSSEARDGVSRALAEIGIPLEILPTDKAAFTYCSVDGDTQQLLEELRGIKEQLLNDSKFGEVQQLTDQMTILMNLGSELKEAYATLKQLKSIDLDKAEKLNMKICSLEKSRLDVAALYDTKFWEEALLSGPGYAATYT